MRDRRSSLLCFAVMPSDHFQQIGTARWSVQFQRPIRPDNRGLLLPSLEIVHHHFWQTFEVVFTQRFICVATPGWAVVEVAIRRNLQPIATIGAVPKPNFPARNRPFDLRQTRFSNRHRFCTRIYGATVGDQCLLSFRQTNSHGCPHILRK